MGNHISRAAPVSDSGPPPHQLSSRDTSPDAEDGGQSCTSWFSCGSSGIKNKPRPLPSAVNVTDRPVRKEDGPSLPRKPMQFERSDTNALQQHQDFQNMSIGELIQLHTSVSNTGVSGFAAASGRNAKTETSAVTTTIVKPQSPSGDVAFGASKLAFLRGTIFNSFMTEHELAYMAYKSELRTYSAGSVLYSQGSDSSGELFIQCSGDLCVEIENEGVPTPVLTAAMKDDDDIPSIDPIPQASSLHCEDRESVPIQQPEHNQHTKRTHAHVDAISRLLVAAASVNTVSDPSQPSSSPPRIFHSNASTTVGTAASSPENTNTSNSPRLATPQATNDDSDEIISSPMFHRLALQKAGWIFGFESLYKLPPPPAHPFLPSASSFEEHYVFPLNAQSNESATSDQLSIGVEPFQTDDHAPSIPRLANVVSTTDSMCLTISREKMQRFFRRFPRLYEPFLSACGSHIEHCIGNVSFLSQMSPAKLKLFASLFSPSSVHANTALFEEDDPSCDESKFYFLHSGSVKIRLPANKVSLTGIRPKSGNLFAGSSKLVTSPAVQSLTMSSATSSTSPLRSEVMSSTSFSTRFVASPASTTPLIGGVKGLDSSHYEQVLEAGSFFGELALLLELPRVATITTVTDCILFTIPRQTLRNFIQLVPDSLPRFRETIGSFCLQTTYLLQIPSVANAFYEFCAKEFSTENLDFVKACARFKSMSDAHLHGKLHSKNRKSVNAALSPHQSDSRRSIVNEPSIIRSEPSVIKEDEVTPIYNKTDVGNPDCVNYQRLPRIFVTLAEEINDEFISQLAPRQVNLSAKSRSNIAQIITERHVYPDMFLEATREIHSLMNADSFIRFRKDPMFQNALNQLNKAATVVHHLAKWEKELQEEMNAREELEAVAIDAGILPPTAAYLARKDAAASASRKKSAAEVSKSSKPSSPQVPSKAVNVSYWGKDVALPTQARTADIVAFSEVRQEKQREALAEASFKRSLNKSSNSGASSKTVSRRTSDNSQLYDFNIMQTDALAPTMIHRPMESVEGGIPLTMSGRTHTHGPRADKGLIDTDDSDTHSPTAQYLQSVPVSPTRGVKDIDHSPQTVRRAFLKDKLKAELLEQEFAHLT